VHQRRHPAADPKVESGLEPSGLFYYVFQQFKAPVVYTPGDNEWPDCHKTKQLSAGDPLKELASVRQLFFAKPGGTLGMTEKTVYSTAKRSISIRPIPMMHSSLKT
jgi:hypothetical protein